MKLKNYLLVSMLALVALAFQSCSSDKAADASEILATIPSDVSLVTVINTQSILEKSGCKVDGEKIEAGADVKNAITKIADPQAKKIISGLLSGESGINPSVLVIFREGYNTYLTGSVYDTAKMKAWIEANGSDKFVSTNGIDVSGNTAIADNRFWINMQSGSIDLGDVRHFNTLAENQSFLQNDYADKLVSITKDVEGWGNINGIVNTTDMNFQDKAVMQMILQSLFEDPSALTFSINTVQGTAESEISVINSKGKTAKFLLPSDKLNTDAIAGIGGTADMAMAFSIPGKLIEALQKDSKSNTPNMLSIVTQQLSCVDGTAAVVSGMAYSNSAKGFVTTNGKDTSGLLSMLQSLGFTTSVKGNIVDISKGAVTGAVPVADMANEFKGAIAGFVVGKVPDQNFSQIIKSASVMLMNEGGGMKIKVKANTLNPKENPIITLLNFK